MTEYATPTKTSGGILGTTAYWRISGIALLATAILGFVLVGINKADLLGKDFLTFDTTHNIVHIVLAAVALFFGFANIPAGASKLFAIIVGGVYFLLGVVGFLDSGNLFGLGTSIKMHLELGENLVHLVIGGYGLTAGFMAKA